MLKRILCRRDGSAAVEFIMTTAVLILIFAMLVSALVYITQYYHAAFITRRLVRSIEIAGEYDPAKVSQMVTELGGTCFNSPRVTVTANYWSGRKIQLRSCFTVTLKASYRIVILRFGQADRYLSLPITVKLQGMSEVYWK